MLPVLGMLFYNSAQAYLFPAIMVHATLRFAFTSKGNGYLISIAASTSSIYLFIVLYGIPRVQRRARKADRPNASESDECEAGVVPLKALRPFTGDFFYAILSMSVQLVVIPCLTITHLSWVLYALMCFVALGLAAPSFIKSYAVSVARADKSVALANLVAAESLGGLLSPIILGSTQSVTSNGAFIVASCLIGVAIFCIIARSLGR